jgi:hypothetical protein
MRPIRFLVALGLIAVVVGGTTWNWKQRKEILRLRALHAAFVDQAAMRKRARQSPQPAAQPNPGGQDSRAISGRGEEKSRDLIVLDVSPESVPDPQIAIEMRKFRALEEKATVEHGYAELFRMLEHQGSISPEQIGQFTGLILQRNETSTHAFEAYFEANKTIAISKTDWFPAVSAALTAATDPVDQQIKQTLGETGFALYLQYQQTLTQRNAVELVERSLNDSNAPLSTGQSEQLVAILKQFSRPEGQNNSDATQIVHDQDLRLSELIDPATTTVEVTNAAIRAASTVLTPIQLEALQEVQIQQQTHAKLTTWLEQLQHPAQPASSSAP